MKPKYHYKVVSRMTGDIYSSSKNIGDFDGYFTESQAHLAGDYSRTNLGNKAKKFKVITFVAVQPPVVIMPSKQAHQLHTKSYS